ncbi:Beta-galactosidase [Dactylellina cionopaga]|nr:Beta-galactosidase [Dactylellina cionopaga]
MRFLLWIISLLLAQHLASAKVIARGNPTGRERISFNSGWRFKRWEKNPDGVIYDNRTDLAYLTNAIVLKPWVLPSANEFINDPAKLYQRPAGDPGSEIPYVQASFDDGAWETVNLPHDWAIKGPFYTGDTPVVGGGMGRLPSHGIGWYRNKLTKTEADKGKSIYLEIDGAMSYAVVWLNRKLIGGWPYPYNSFRLDLTPYLELGAENQLAIRLDNPNDSARWYPGGGLYRNVWITKTDPIQIGHYGTYITARDVSAASAIVDFSVRLENKGTVNSEVEVVTGLYILDPESGRTKDKVGEYTRKHIAILPGEQYTINDSLVLENPKLWGPAPMQTPNLYVAITRLYQDHHIIDSYETSFGIRSVVCNGSGLTVNGEKVMIQGVNEHHDLGAIGAAFNVRAAERKLEILHEMGVNAIRMSHNPPAPELLDLTDKMGFLVIDEIFDSWVRNKTPNDFYLIFPDWHEPDLRSFIRRDRNHPSVINWSYGNEVGEQYTDEDGAAISQMLLDIIHHEDPTRPGTASENYATPDMPFPRVVDVISINYQGSGIRDTNAYSNLVGIKTSPLYPKYHAKFPNKMLQGSETASTLSTRGTYIFPVTNDNSAPINDTSGGDSLGQKVSAYELYTANFGSSPDKVFYNQDLNPYVAGEYVWTGFDYIGEPTPYYSARSSYCGIIDLAGFKKDRFWLYQARWRPDLPTAHILPHWSWPDRVGKVTPVHVFSSGDEAELFLNGRSQGRKTRAQYEYRFRWDKVVYEPGELEVVTYKNGKEWARETVRTAGPAAGLKVIADRSAIKNDGYDLSYITVTVVDAQGNTVANANDKITFSVAGPGEIVATDNGDPADMVAFPSKTRAAYSGLALGIVRATLGASGRLTITASAKGLESGKISVRLGSA